MKLAVVIGVGTGPEAFTQATKTQALLLTQMGEKLGSVRIAVPRHLHSACAGAIADRPDVLVVAGGPRTARRAGQVAYQHGVPILFLPGLSSSHWAQRLWGSLSLEAMIEALSREEIGFSRLGVGIAGGEIFFDEARCGLLPQLALTHGALREAEGFSERWRVLARAASLGQSIVRHGMRVHCAQTAFTEAAAVIVTAQGFNGSFFPSQPQPRLQSFSCAAWMHSNPFAHARALIKAAIGADWRQAAEPERFECDTLIIELRDACWIDLDGDPVWFKGPVEFRFLPKALKTCAFRLERRAS
jgi:diacylglycerol kinase family enzyme